MKVCEMACCSNRSVSGGLCDKHRKRLERHGHTNNTRPNDWGERESHPLYNSWVWMRRMRTKYSISPDWEEDFWQFVEDMGDRPSSKHQLFRVDKTKGFSPSNCRWKRTIGSKSKNEYARKWRKENSDKVKNNDLQRRHGITLKEYQQLLENQDGVCAICKRLCEHFSLAVDHDHSTGTVRGLLCSLCNRGIGLFRDDVSILQEAIEYLSQSNGS